MNNLVTYTQQLPDTLEDLSKFVLIGREKLNSVRAEIRAIEKIHLAEEVRNQKRGEAQMLSEAVLDAEVRLGDLLKLISKDPGGRPPKTTDTAVHSLPKPKKEVINDLGLSEKQAQRFETLANNKDLVEQVKLEARENDDLPTRTRVIDLARQRKRKDEKSENFCAYIDECKKVSDKFHDAIYSFVKVEVSPERLKMWAEILESGVISVYLNEIQADISKLIMMQNFLKGVKK